MCVCMCVFKWACVSFVGVATKRANECGKGKGSEVLKYFMYFFTLDERIRFGVLYFDFDFVFEYMIIAFVNWWQDDYME